MDRRHGVEPAAAAVAQERLVANGQEDAAALPPEVDADNAGRDGQRAVSGASGGRRNGPDAVGRPAERRRARRAAVQVLYEVDCTDHRPGVAVEYRQAEEGFSAETLNFLYWLVSGVIRYRADLDQLIGRYAPEWPVEQLSVVDRSLLRLSIFELSSPDADAPPKVVINEAVELAKLFGSDGSPRFVNGVLGTALREISHPNES